MRVRLTLLGLLAFAGCGNNHDNGDGGGGSGGGGGGGASVTLKSNIGLDLTHIDRKILRLIDNQDGAFPGSCSSSPPPPR